MTHTAGLRIGRIAGAPVIVTGGSALLAAVLYLLVLPGFRATLGDSAGTFAIAAVLPISLLASILIHELAHGLLGRAFGMPVTEYVLTVWGGHTSFGPHVDRPGRSALVAAAGPAANGVVALLVWLIAEPTTPLGVVLGMVAYVNVLLAVFNILPGLPMDGGRLLESAVWAATGNRRTGTLVAARSGQVLAATVAAFGLWSAIAATDYFRAIWAMLIAGVLWMGAREVIQRLRAQASVEHVDLRSLITPATARRETETVADWLHAAGPDQATVLIDSGGQLSGVVDADVARQVPAHAQAQTTLRSVGRTLDHDAVLTRTRGPDAVAQVASAAQRGAHTLAVVVDGRVVGIIAVSDVAAVLRQVPNRPGAAGA